MYLWRRNRPRAVYDRVAIIHGIAYLVKDEIVFKHRMAEWVLPSAMQKHIKYNPRHLPVVIVMEKECNNSTLPSVTSSVPSFSYGESASLLPAVSLE